MRYMFDRSQLTAKKEGATVFAQCYYSNIQQVGIYFVGCIENVTRKLLRLPSLQI
jgi:hypothetical protein